MKQFVTHRPRWQIGLAFIVVALVLAVVPILGVITQATAAGLTSHAASSHFAITFEAKVTI